MIIHQHYEQQRNVSALEIDCDLCIVGGGLAGTCAAITAAREGLSVVLIQDRPVLGGNASSEVRLWALGATAHQHNNNRFSREGGVIDEILLENLHRNREGNPILFDTVLLEKVTAEENIRLLLNTVATGITKDGSKIGTVSAYNAQNETRYTITADFFCDASGDGLIAFLAGGAFRFGAETADEFGEQFAPDRDEYGELLGHSIFFYTKDTGKPVRFVPPAYALKDVPARIPRYRDFSVDDQGCRFWWIEYGGRLDTIHDTEQIKWELWKIIFGVWDYLKNSGEYPETETMTLEWVGAIPGKRESRRFEGEVMLTQQDIVEQREWPDAVSVGGWSLDLHPADGIYTARPGCNQYHAIGVYQIPYRAMIIPAIPNLLLAGRIISASHVAFGSTRVMLTCAHGAQAVGMAAAICMETGIQPVGIVPDTHPEILKQLQLRLLRRGQFIPGVPLADPKDISHSAVIRVSSSLDLNTLSADSETYLDLDRETAVLLPLPKGQVPRITVIADVAFPGKRFGESVASSSPAGAHGARPVKLSKKKSWDSQPETSFVAELRISGKPENFTPEQTLSEVKLPLTPGASQFVEIDFSSNLDMPRFVFLVFRANPRIRLHAHDMSVPAVRLLRHTHDQVDPGTAGVEGFELWLPERRPQGRIPAIGLSPSVNIYGAENLKNGFSRPFMSANCWVPDSSDSAPHLELSWDEPQEISSIELVFDTDHDHALESVLHGHPESEMPNCVKEYRIHDDHGKVIVNETENYKTLRIHSLAEPVRTKSLRLEIGGTWSGAPGGLFDVRVYGN